MIGGVPGAVHLIFRPGPQARGSSPGTLQMAAPPARVPRLPPALPGF